MIEAWPFNAFEFSVDALLAALIKTLEDMDPGWAYALLFVSAILENIVPPVPGDTVVVFSAYMVGRGVWGIAPVFLATVAGGVVGFMSVFYLGKRYGRALFSVQDGRIFSAEGLDRAEQWLDRYGFGLILANRFLTGIRSVVAISAGMGGMSPLRVAFGGALSMVVWNGLLLYVGMLLGQNWSEVAVLLKQYNRILLGVLAIVAIVLVVRWFRKA